jgi:hypothetical protein
MHYCRFLKFVLVNFASKAVERLSSKPGMRLLIIVTFYLSALLTNGQSRTIKGKVVDESTLTTFPGVRIQSKDTVLLGTTDSNGNFEIEMPAATDELLLSSLGMEWTLIKVPNNCDNAEIIMMSGGVYDFMTVGKENRKRYKRFKDLRSKHRQAFAKGVFTSIEPCVTYIFKKH